MSAQKESVRIRGRSGRPASSRERVAAPPPRDRAVRGRGRLLWALAALLIVAGAVGAGISRARSANLPPLLAWDGPDLSSGTRETELRLVEAARRAPSDVQAQIALGEFYLEDAKPFEALWALRDAQRLDPKTPKPRLLMAQALV